MKTKNRHGIVICGAYGLGNAGDEAILSAIVAALRERCLGTEITVLSAGRGPIAAGDVTVIPKYSVRVWFAALRGTRIFIHGGGSLLQDVTSRRSLRFYLFTLRAAHALGCRTMLFSAGIGPLLYPASRRRTARVLNRCADSITLRDADSLDFLKRLGVEPGKLRLSADPVFLIPPVQTSRETSLGIVLRPWPGLDERVGEIILAVRTICTEQHLRPVFVCPGPGDREAAEMAAAFLSELLPEITDNVRRLGGMTAVLSMRLHGLIFALCGGVPAAGLSYDPKVDALCREAACPCLPLAEADAGKITAMLTELLHADSAARTAAVQTLRERAEIAVDIAEMFIKE